MLMANDLLANARIAKSWREHLRMLDHASAIAFEDVKNRSLFVLFVHFVSHANISYANSLVVLSN